ncbi:outer membrane beta-barrel protein [Terrihabitans sp. B22-R8]|uniref:outer membrane beta-barrel protein n=1 Tax=Terrihabitans sp. B22-R8 TaxID=3425128 RepID=UPI00403CBBE2
MRRARPALCALLLAGTLALPSRGSAQELRGSLPAEAVPANISAETSDGTDPAAPPLAEADPFAANAATPDVVEPSAPLPEASALPTRTPRRRAEEEDAYAPIGIRTGAFIVRPQVDQNVGYTDNARAEPNGEGSAYSRTIGRLDVESDWPRHVLRGSIQAGYTAYREFPDLDAPDFTGEASARLDVRREFQLNLAVRAAQESESPGDPELPDGLASRPEVRHLGGTIGGTLKPNRASLTIEALADRTLYEDAELNSGEIVNNSERSFTAYELRLRSGYEISTALEPFVEASVNRRERDQEIDALGLRRSSDGYEVAIGTRFEPSALLTVVGKVGYRDQISDDPSLPRINGLVAEGSLIWRPTPLTTITLTADSSLDETTRPDTAGALVRTATAGIEHALRRNLLLKSSLAFQHSDYSGIDYNIDEITAELGVEYRMTRTLAIHGRVAHHDYNTTLPGEDYTANLIEAGISVRR